jgi:hypothetical protein
MKTLSVVIILSSAVATPAFAQDTSVHESGSRYGLESKFHPRGAHNQLNGPSYAGTRTRDHWSPENLGNNERDPSIPGGEDTTRRPASS